MATRRTKWWTLVWPDGSLDIDHDNHLHLETSRNDAMRESLCFDPDATPVQVEIRLLGNPVKRKKPS